MLINAKLCVLLNDSKGITVIHNNGSEFKYIALKLRKVAVTGWLPWCISRNNTLTQLKSDNDYFLVTARPCFGLWM